MDSQGSESGTPDGQGTERLAADAQGQAADPSPQQAAPVPAAQQGQRFLDRFGRGTIAIVAVLAGIIAGAGGAMVIADDGHDGWRHHHRGFDGPRGFGHDWDGGGRGPMMGGPPGYGYGPGAQQGQRGIPPAPQQGQRVIPPAPPQGNQQAQPPAATTPQRGTR